MKRKLKIFLITVMKASFFWSGFRDQIACSLLGGVWFQSQNSGYPVTNLCTIKIRVLLFPSTDGHVPFLSPPSEIPLSSLCSVNLPVHLSLLLLPPLPPFAIHFLSSLWAPVVTRRPPVWLTGGRCHAALGCIPSVPALDGFPPPTCAAGVTWLGCRWRA